MTPLKYTCIISLLFLMACKDKKNEFKTHEIYKTSKAKQQAQEKIIDEHLKNGAWTYHMYSQEWQEEIDKGLKKDSTVAYLWQQKAMPLFKMRKYEVGLDYLDNAVKYDSERWQDYRAFIKCIFAKTYHAAILDFEDCKTKYGNRYVMDHTYDFYIGLSYLQLHQFEKAELIFEKDYQFQLNDKGEDWLHHTDFFYYGIAKYELHKYEEAIQNLDKALKIYPNFSEAQLYKAICLNKLGKVDEANQYYTLAEENGRKGNTINEENTIYELYPYQRRWK